MSGPIAARPPEVAIVLSVYDGDRFIAQQLDSIAAQAGVDWTLTWRDDGSQPSRASDPVLAAFADRFPGRVHQAATSRLRLGVGRSYMALLAEAPDADYLAFADQDDVWLPAKLARAVGRLAAVPAQEPAMYCGRQVLVDAALTPIGQSAVPHRPLGFGNALVQNVATGCTMVLNRAARQAVAAMPAPADALHDWWCYLILSGIGARLIYDPEPHILYRQHGGNAVGSPESRLRRCYQALRRGPAPFLSRVDQHLAALYAYRDRLTPPSRQLMETLRSARALPGWRRMPMLLRSGVYRQEAMESLVLRLWLLGGRAGR